MGRPRAAARGLATAAALALAACGFEPVLGAPDALGPVRLAEPATRLDFVYRAAIEDRLGAAAPGAPALTWTIATQAGDVAVTEAEETRRVQIVGTADWTLTDPDGGRTVASGRESGFTSWSATGTTVSVRAAQRDAEDRLMRILADRTIARLAILGAGP